MGNQDATLQEHLNPAPAMCAGMTASWCTGTGRRCAASLMADRRTLWCSASRLCSPQTQSSRLGLQIELPCHPARRKPAPRARCYSQTAGTASRRQWTLTCRHSSRRASCGQAPRCWSAPQPSRRRFPRASRCTTTAPSGGRHPCACGAVKCFTHRTQQVCVHDHVATCYCAGIRLWGAILPCARIDMLRWVLLSISSATGAGRQLAAGWGSRRGRLTWCRSTRRAAAAAMSRPPCSSCTASSRSCSWRPWMRPGRGRRGRRTLMSGPQPLPPREPSRSVRFLRYEQPAVKTSVERIHIETCSAVLRATPCRSWSLP